MIEIKITENEAQQRLDRFLRKYLKEYTLGDIYKLFRKNKVKVNRKKEKENYMLEEGDLVQMYIEPASELAVEKPQEKIAAAKPTGNNRLDIVYEDENIILANKPIGLLTHPDKPGDNDTLIDRALGYLIAKGEFDRSTSLTFTPSVCNRLDRNTGGIVIVAKNYRSLKEINQLIRERKIRKLYLCIVKGKIKEGGEIKDFLVKDEESNTVRVTEELEEGAKSIHTIYKPLRASEDYSLMEVELITGRTHQIRAHFRSIGHPLIGDMKYGDRQVNEYFKKGFDLKHQYLYAYRLEFSEIDESMGLKYLEGKSFKSKLPQKLESIRERLF